jgi:hypothetical protein
MNEAICKLESAGLLLRTPNSTTCSVYSTDSFKSKVYVCILAYTEASHHCITCTNVDATFCVYCVCMYDMYDMYTQPPCAEEWQQWLQTRGFYLTRKHHVHVRGSQIFMRNKFRRWLWYLKWCKSQQDRMIEAALYNSTNIQVHTCIYIHTYILEHSDCMNTVAYM